MHGRSTGTLLPEDIVYRLSRYRVMFLLPTLLVAALWLAGCQASPQATQPEPGGKAPLNTSLPNPPAVGEPTATSLPRGKGTPSALDTSLWTLSEGTLQGVRYSFRYPPDGEWQANLSYCAPEAKDLSKNGSNLSGGCASTDILVGQKARDVGQLVGREMLLNGKRAVKEIDIRPRNSSLARMYTVLLYDVDGAPLFGFSTAIGYGTTGERRQWITDRLEGVASTLTAERQK